MYTHLAVALLAVAAAASPVANTPQKREIPVGAAIMKCTVPGVVALTFDDGPYTFTAKALDTLKSRGAKATFFLNGQNWGSISNYEPVVKRMKDEGHQIASHTWAHADLATLSADGIKEQMQKLEIAIENIIGASPTYMRPPYYSYTDVTLATLGELGYHVIHGDIDTNDWKHTEDPAASVKAFEEALNAGGTISLAHDVHQSTVDTLLPAMLDIVERKGLKTVTVGECLGDPKSNWYAKVEAC